MKRFFAVRVFVGVALLSTLLYGTSAVYATDLYLTSGSYTASDSTYQRDAIRVGTDSGGSTTDSAGSPYVATLDVVAGARVQAVYSFNSNTVSVTGGRVLAVVGLYNDSVLNLNGGDIPSILAYDKATVNISGNGNILPGILLGGSTSKANFVGSGFSFVYKGFGDSPYSSNTDHFTITGTVGGVGRFYDLYIYNGNTAGDGTPRQFTFNGAAVAVPEAGTLALWLPALSFAGIALRRYCSAR